MAKNKVSIIVAVGKNLEIGKDNQLLWHIKDDLKLFMSTTSQHVVMHGRKSFESIGKPLRNRTNIIITRDRSYAYPGCFVCHTIEDALELANRLELKEEIFVLGGAQIYEQAMDQIDRMYISHVDGEFPEADAHFPKIDYSQWEVQQSMKYPKNQDNEYAFEFIVYERKS